MAPKSCAIRPAPISGRTIHTFISVLINLDPPNLSLDTVRSCHGAAGKIAIKFRILDNAGREENVPGFTKWRISQTRGSALTTMDYDDLVSTRLRAEFLVFEPSVGTYLSASDKASSLSNHPMERVLNAFARRAVWTPALAAAGGVKKSSKRPEAAACPVVRDLPSRPRCSALPGGLLCVPARAPSRTTTTSRRSLPLPNPDF